MRTNPQTFAVLKLLTTALSNLTEEQAAQIAAHIKAFGKAIERCEQSVEVAQLNGRVETNHDQNDNAEAH